MNCPGCKTINENENVFCVSCGAAIFPNTSAELNVPPSAQFFNSQQFSQQNYIPSHSTETRVVPNHQFSSSMHNFNPAIPNSGAYQTRPDNRKFVWLGAAAVILLLTVGSVGFYFLSKQSVSAEILPEHLGMFVQSLNKDRLDEIKKLDFTNVLDGKNNLLKDETLPTLEEKANWIIYSEGKDIPVNELRLIQLDTITDEGGLKQLDFQAAPVEGKPEMKRLRVADGLANGRYAFALLDGFLDEGKHKFWAFQIKNSGKSDNGDALKATTFPTKPKQPKQKEITQGDTPNSPTVPRNPPPSTPPPPDTLRVAYANTSNLVLRGGPSQSYPKVGGLRRGQKVFVIAYSSNYERFDYHYANFAYIQTESGKKGWVYTAFLN